MPKSPWQSKVSPILFHLFPLQTLLLACPLANTLWHSSGDCPFLHSWQIALTHYAKLREVSLLMMAILKLRPLLLWRHYSNFSILLADNIFGSIPTTIARTHTQCHTSFIHNHSIYEKLLPHQRQLHFHKLFAHLVKVSSTESLHHSALDSTTNYATSRSASPIDVGLNHWALEISYQPIAPTWDYVWFYNGK